MDWKKYVGKRVLISFTAFPFPEEYADEAVVLEVSPSGKFVCFDFSPEGGSNRVWKVADKVVLLEVLEGKD